MFQKDYNTKKRNFKHLTKEKRAQLEILLKLNMPKTKIAKELGISRSTLYRELNINHLPRKIFNYHTSYEMFNSVLFDIAI